MSDTKETVCPCNIEQLCGNVYVELRLHEGGTALVDPRTISAVARNCYDKAVVWTDCGGCFPTIHEYDEIIDAMRKAGSKCPTQS